MARTIITKPSVGTTSATVLNDALTAIATQTANVDADNLAEEGLDARAFTANITSVSAGTPYTNETVATQALSTTWAQVNPGVGARLSSIPALAANERLRLVASIEFRTTSGQSGLPSDASVELRLRKRVGGVESTITDTLRALFPAAASDPSAALVGGPFGGPARVRIMGVVDGAETLEWAQIEIRSTTGTPTVQFGEIAFHGVIFKRVTV